MEFYEDVEVGTVVEHGATTMTRADIVSFATEFDPQPIHVDETAAAESMFDGLIASGWHTASVCMRLLVEGVLGSQAALGGSGRCAGTSRSDRAIGYRSRWSSSRRAPIPATTREDDSGRRSGGTTRRA